MELKMPNYYSPNQAIENRWPILTSSDTPGLSKVALDRPVCVVGARAKVHLPLPSVTISKAHALLIHDGLGVWIRDLGSKNHTFVNGRIIREMRLSNGDRVQFGPFTFRCASDFTSTAVAEPLLAGELRLEANRSTRVYQLNKQTLVIGSRNTSDVLIPGDTVSNSHAVIFVRDGRRYVRDLTSISGTTVNGKPIRETELRHGDEIRIASARLVYNLAGGKIMPGISSSDDTKVGMPSIFRGVKKPAPRPVAARVPDMDLVMPWERNEPVTIDLD
jgi:pSer/pThr/pTyr-binding forkhead associated (FHA) protein